MRPATIFPLLVLLTAAPASGAVFKWTGADGRIQYGDYPPAGVQTEQLRTAPVPKSVPATRSLQQQLKALDKRHATEQKQATERKQKQQAAKDRRINCTRARNNLKRLSYGGNRLIHLPDGSYQRLDEKQKQDLLRKNRNAVKKFCD